MRTRRAALLPEDAIDHWRGKDARVQRKHKTVCTLEGSRRWMLRWQGFFFFAGRNINAHRFASASDRATPSYKSLYKYAEISSATPLRALKGRFPQQPPSTII